MQDITPELIEVIKELHDTTVKLSEITQILLNELNIQKYRESCNHTKTDI